MFGFVRDLQDRFPTSVLNPCSDCTWVNVRGDSESKNPSRYVPNFLTNFKSIKVTSWSRSDSLPRPRKNSTEKDWTRKPEGKLDHSRGYRDGQLKEKCIQSV